MSKIFLAVPVLATVLLLACGGESDAAKVDSVLRTYVDRYIDRQPAEMHALLDSGSRERCSEESFVAFVSAARDALGEREFEVAEIRDLTVEGDTASASVVVTVDGEAGEPTLNTLVREDGEWRLELPSGSC